MTLTDRDRKIALVIVPIAILAAYWFLLLSPKREEAAQAGQALQKQEQARDQAQQKAQSLESAKSTFSTDYATMVRLGKAVPTNVDMPSLIVQLDAAARGTGISFDKVAAGERSTAATPAASSGSGGNGGNAAAGGAPAGTPGGKAVESANNTKAAGDKQAAAKSGVDATTSSSAKKGGVPVGGGSTSSGAAGAAGAAPACEPGLECVPLDFAFRGSFFDLADFFHKLKRFVKVANERVNVGGRLMTVDSFKFTTDTDSFPKLEAEVSATVYLSPKKEGATAGASPQGPSATPAASGGGSGGGTPSAAPGAPPTAPTATATP